MACTMLKPYPPLDCFSHVGWCLTPPHSPLPSPAPPPSYSWGYTPNITSVDPAGGSNGTTLTVLGAFFDDVTRVLFISNTGANTR